jgi:hypothetical protein
MRTVIIVIGALVMIQDASLTKQEVQKAPAIASSVSSKRAEELKATLENDFKGVSKKDILVAAAVKGSTAIGAVVSTTKSDLAIVKDPCSTESVKRPVGSGNSDLLFPEILTKSAC